jgi:DNA-binding CsgD family transcriptional regulator
MTEKHLIAGPALTSQQIAVLGRMARGDSERGCARSLGIARGTVRRHIDSASAVLGAKTVAHAVANAIRLGII